MPVYETEELTEHSVRTSTMLVALRLLAAQGLIFVAALVLVWLAAILNGIFLRGQAPPLLSPGGIVFVLALVDLGLIGYYLWDWWRITYVIRPGEVVIRRAQLPMWEEIHKPDTKQPITIERTFWGKLYDYGTVRFRISLPPKQVCLFNVPSPEIYAEMIQRGGAEPPEARKK